MIKSFLGKEAEKIWVGQRSRRLPQAIQQLVWSKLRMLNNTQTLDDLQIPPANRLERLKGGRAGHYSIRINDQWRIFFWLEAGRYFGTSESFWMGLQADYDLEEARKRLGDRLEREVRSRAA